MNWVSDAGPINYLLLIDSIQLLPTLFDGIVIPEAVLEELTESPAPTIVSGWAKDLPGWVSIASPIATEGLSKLGKGETAAISLARQLEGALLCDDEPARRFARLHGLAVIGTLGILKRAHVEGHTDIDVAIEKLSKTNFYLTESLIQRVLSEAHRMRAESGGE